MLIRLLVYAVVVPVLVVFLILWVLYLHFPGVRKKLDKDV